MIRARLRRHRDGEDHTRADGDVADGDVVEIEPGALAGVFAAPRWLRDLGWMAWLLVGVAAFLVGAVWLLALTQTIVLPVVAAAIIAAVLSPVMGWLERHGVGRGLGTAIVLLSVVAARRRGRRGGDRGHLEPDRRADRQSPRRRGRDRGLARGPGRDSELGRGRQGGCELLAQRRLPRPDRRCSAPASARSRGW